MITGEIKIHPEPVQTYTTYTGPHNTNKDTPEWKAKCAAALKIAKDLYRVGDKVPLKSNPQTIMLIKGFNEDPLKVITYKEQPCVIYAIGVQYDKPGVIPTSFCLDELNWDELIPVDPVTTTQEANPNE